MGNRAAQISSDRQVILLPADDLRRASQLVGRGDHLLADGSADQAVSSYKAALAVVPTYAEARRKLATLLVTIGRRDESFQYWYTEAYSGAAGLRWVQQTASNAMQGHNLSLAGEFASLLAQLRWASHWYPHREASDGYRLPIQEAPRFLTIPKLWHDIEQFEYLRRRGILAQELKEIIAAYKRVIVRLRARGFNGRAPLDNQAVSEIGAVYNRIVYVKPTPRVSRALSGKWDARSVENAYIHAPPGVVVVDSFLSPEALEGIREFCLESTVWSANRYGYGRLGAFFQDGFNCPLLVQVAEELRDALPRVIGSRYPLRQLWGFKNGHTLPGDSTTHADFAAVNVNYWVTPDDANRDPSGGGLIIYDVDAPPHWDFATYNGRSDVIAQFLRRQNSRAINIPYRQNRAVIFNSDLFHGTAALNFHPGYENRRINITMLYGDRENEVHHRHLARPESTNTTRAWRSRAFARARRSI